MSLQSMIWALHLKPADLDGVHDGAHLTLVLLADYMDPTGRGAWPSVETLAHARGVSTRSIRRHLEQLEEAGLVVRGDQTAARLVPANRRPVVWDLGRSRGDAGATPATLWGDSGGAPGVTPGVTQSPNKPSRESKPTPHHAREVDELIDMPHLDCIHGHPVKYYHDRRLKKRVPMCPECRRRGVVTPVLPSSNVPDPDAPDPVALARQYAAAAKTPPKEHHEPAA